MKKLLFLFFLFFAFSAGAKTEIDKAFRTRKAKGETRFRVHSPELMSGKQMSNILISNSGECDGKNMSPKLIWRNAPADTKSFAVVFKDLDKNSDKAHWIVYNISIETSGIPGNATGNRKLMPEGSFEAINDFNLNGFEGVCVNDNSKHNFILKLYALNVDSVNLNKKSMPAVVEEYLEQHKIAVAEIKVFYKNK